MDRQTDTGRRHSTPTTMTQAYPRQSRHLARPRRRGLSTAFALFQAIGRHYRHTAATVDLAGAGCDGGPRREWALRGWWTVDGGWCVVTCAWCSHQPCLMRTQRTSSRRAELPEPHERAPSLPLLQAHDGSQP